MKFVSILLCLSLFLTSCSNSGQIAVDETGESLSSNDKKKEEPKKEGDGGVLAPKTCETNLVTRYGLKNIKYMYKAHNAETDSYGLYLGGYALYLFGVGRFPFVKPGLLTEYEDGYAHLQGEVYSEENPGEVLRISIILKDKRTGDEPKKELKDIAYTEDGGPIDTDLFKYYDIHDGLLRGKDDLVGTCIDIVGDAGHAWQQGFGANGRNINYGASAWFNIEFDRPAITKMPPYWDADKGDINIDLEVPACIKNAVSDQYAKYQRNHVLWLAGIGFLSAKKDDVTLIEFPDGTAKILGEVYLQSNPDWKFELEMDLAGKTWTAPEGSPYKELEDDAYVDVGPIDPATWRYYPSFSGTLTGKGPIAGAKLDLTRRGPALQVGKGANGTNDNYGGSSWFDYVTSSQPENNQISLDEDNVGDINFDVYYCIKIEKEYEDSRYPLNE